MKFFLDSADLTEIRTVLERGFARGITTNPTLLREQIDVDPVGHLQKLTHLVAESDPSLPVSVQVMTTEATEMIHQAELLHDKIDYPNLVIKVPCGWDGLYVIKQLRQRGITVNCTACITPSQALLAAAAGASYVSMFYGKISDTGTNAANAISTTAKLLTDSSHDTELIVGSIRKQYDIQEMAKAGADIATVPFPYLPKIIAHEKTDEAVDRFAVNFQPL